LPGIELPDSGIAGHSIAGSGFAGQWFCWTVVLLDSGFAGQWFCWTVGRNREFFGKQLMPVVPG
jgi:hypothetical protein